MPRICKITGKKPLAGHNISHAHNVTPRMQRPNIQSKRIFIPELGRWVRLKVSTRALRTINKKGNRDGQRMVEQYRERRTELKAIIKDPNTPEDERDLAFLNLQKLPRNSSPVRVRNRCVLTGRPRGYYRKFGLSRIALRDLALRGELPGVIKASW
nr:small ribosomal subunit protein uS14-like [Nerophis lumbriciformis]